MGSIILEEMELVLFVFFHILLVQTRWAEL
nr:MAG TPA: hypothetical protein [Caudoviricetes sp.]